MTSICTILSIVATKDFYLEQLDVKTTFLYGDLDEEIYIAQPQRFEVKGKEISVQIEEKFIWLEASTSKMVSKI